MNDLVELVRERIMENRRFTITELSSDFPILVAQNCYRVPAVQKIMRQVGAKTTDTRTQSKAHGVSIDISVKGHSLRRLQTRGETVTCKTSKKL